MARAEARLPPTLTGLSAREAATRLAADGPFLGLTVPLLPAQILWINLLTHGVPGVAFGAEPAEPRTMRRPPRPPQESVLGGGLLGAVLRTASLLAATVLGAGMWLTTWAARGSRSCSWCSA